MLRSSLSLLLISFILLSVVDTPSAYSQTRRRWSSRFDRASTSANKTPSHHFFFPPLVGSLKKVEFLYGFGKEELFTDKVRIRLLIGNDEVLRKNNILLARVQVEKLSRIDFIVQNKDYEVIFDDDDYTAVLEINNLKPNTVYRFQVNLGHKAFEFGTKDVALGTVKHHYYGVTDGVTELEKVKARITMKAISEWYRWQTEDVHGNNRPSYARSRLWAWEFYRWVVRDFINSPNRKGEMYSLARMKSQLIDRDIPIHGEYCTKPGYMFIPLAYDKTKGYLWFVGGAFSEQVVLYAYKASTIPAVRLYKLGKWQIEDPEEIEEN